MPRILLVEDEEHLAAGIRFNLELDGYEVETIGDGLRAVERLAPAHGEAPPAVRPRAPRRDAARARRLPDRRAHARRPANYTPVLMLTAQGPARGRGAGARGRRRRLPAEALRPAGAARARQGAHPPPRLGARARRGAADRARRRRATSTSPASSCARADGERVRLTLLEAMLLKLLVAEARAGRHEGRDPREGLEPEPRHRDARRRQLRDAPAPPPRGRPAQPAPAADRARRRLPPLPGVTP